MRLYSLLLFLALNLCISDSVSGQFTDPEAAKEVLKDKNISEDEIEKRLKERGFDINNIDPTDPEALIEVESAIQEIIAEIESERNDESIDGNKGLENAEQTNSGKSNAGLETEESARKRDIKNEEGIVEEINEVQRRSNDTIKIYGQQLFLEYKPAPSSSKPAPNYILDSGDELGIAIFGASEASFNFEINLQGYIQPNTLGRIYLKGLTFEQAKELLYKKFSGAYSFTREQFAVTINFYRQISVNVVGNIKRPGSYKLGANNTITQVLALAGGPNNIGSFRNIKIISSDGNNTFDTYDFLNNPTIEKSFFLSDNDYVHIPSYFKQVELSGEVNNPMIYELEENEGLIELLRYAGGLKPQALTNDIEIVRVINNETKIINVDYDDTKLNSASTFLLDGDKVHIKRINSPIDNKVVVEGAVQYPGDYEVSDGLKISDLLDKAELLDDAFLGLAYLKRQQIDGSLEYLKVDLKLVIEDPSVGVNLVLQPKDVLSIYYSKKRNPLLNAKVSVLGAVNNPSEFVIGTKNNLKVEDALQLAGGLSPQALTKYGYVIRRNIENQPIEYIPFSPAEVIANPSSNQNMVLEPFDQIRIFNEFDFEEDAIVEVIGAVKNPVIFNWAKGLTIQDALRFSDGLKLSAAKNRIEIFRLELRDNTIPRTVLTTFEIDEEYNVLSGDGQNIELLPFDIIAVRQIKNYEQHRLVHIQGEVIFAGSYPIVKENERISSFINRAGGLSPEAFVGGATLYRPDESIGYIVVNFEEVMKNPNSEHNISLKEGDIINIPLKKELVQISGAVAVSEVYNKELYIDGKIAIAFEKSLSVKDYINQYAGGFTENAQRGKVTVRDPNGKLKRTQNFGIIKIYPKVLKGSEIFVPQKMKKETRQQRDKEPVDFTKILADSIAQATAILTLVILLQNIDK